jgi:hypothetical protein
VPEFSFRLILQTASGAAVDIADDELRHLAAAYVARIAEAVNTDGGGSKKRGRPPGSKTSVIETSIDANGSTVADAV